MLVKSIRSAFFLLALVVAAEPCLAAGVRVVAPFTVRPGKGLKEIHFAPGEEYEVRGATKEEWQIEYPLEPGVSLRLGIPRKHTVFVERTRQEIAEEQARREKERFEKEQRERGLKKYGDAWLTEEQYGLIASIRQLLYSGGNRVESYRQAVERAELAAGRIAEKATALRSQIRRDNKRLGEIASVANRSGDPDAERLSRAEYAELSEQYRTLSAAVEKRRKQFAKLVEERNEALRKTAAARRKLHEESREFARRVVALQVKHVLVRKGASEAQLEAMEPFVEALKRKRAEGTSAGDKAIGEAGAMFVNVRLNRRLDQTFLVDTGATHVTITEKTAERLGLQERQSDTRIILQTAGSELLEGRIVTLRSVALGAIERQDVTAAVIPHSDEFTPLLGMSFLSRCKWHFSDDGTIVFE
jgi:clan AA aspartic protease (TIGR02281 family)